MSREKSRWRTFTKCPCTSQCLVCSTDGHTRVDIRQQKHRILSNYRCSCLVGWNPTNESNVFHLLGPKKYGLATLFPCCFVFILQGFTLELRRVWGMLLPLLFPHRARIDYCNFVVFLHLQSNSLQ